MIKKNMFKRAALLFLSFFLLFGTVIAPLAKAQTSETWYNPSFFEFASKVFDDSNPQEIFGERYTYAQVAWIIHSMQAFAMGEDLINCMSAAEGDMNQAKDCIEGLQQESGYINSPALAIGSLGDSILSLQPASGIEYAADTAARLRLIPEAYAQGVGFEGLQPALNAWKVTRNMTYALSILVVIVMSFMIMFRVKISPQVVITVQSALPKIVIALVLITFSYAIAGFVIDISYIFLGIIATLIKSSGVNISELGYLDLFNTLVMGSSLFWSFIFSVFLLLLALLAAGALIGAGASLVTAGTAGGLALAGGGIGLIIALLIVFMMIWAGIKILWLLIKTTINVLLLIIAAPFMILSGTFSASGGFGPWLRQLTANVAVYPTVRLMLFLCHYFFWGVRVQEDAFILTEAVANWKWANPLEIQAFGGSETVLPGYLPFDVGSGLFGLVLSIGVFFLIPKIGDMIKAMIEGKPFAYGTAIGEAFAPVGWARGQITSSGAYRAYQEEAGKRRAAIVTKKISDVYKEGPGSKTVRKAAENLAKYNK